jgi:hypothetical protein
MQLLGIQVVVLNRFEGDDEIQEKSLQLSDFKGCFYVIFCGCLVSFVAFCGEILKSSTLKLE